MTNFENWLRAFRKDRKRKMTKRAKAEFLGIRLCGLFTCEECPVYRRWENGSPLPRCERDLGEWAMEEAE